MKRSLVFALMILAALPAWAQRGPASGRREYGSGTFTISCLQAGRVAVQLPRVWAIEDNWTGDTHAIQYRMPDGAPANLTYNTENMTCLVEFWGRESVPVSERLIEEEQRKAQDAETRAIHERLQREGQ